MSSPAFTTGDLAERLGARLEGPADLRITALSDLGAAGAASLSFVGHAKYAAKWADSRAGAALVTEGVALPARKDACAPAALLFVKNADLAMAKALELFAPPPPAAAPGVHPHATVDASATLGAGVSVGPRAVVGPRATLGDGAVLHAGAVVMEDAKIGKGCVLFPGAVVYARCEIGDGSILHAGAVIGADGFGYRAADDGRGLVKIPHIGTVVIGRGVEIGANSCVDRAKFDATVVGDGTKLDNLVQIGHNVRVGRCVVMAAGVAVGGSTEIGDGVQIGGGANLSDHLSIGKGARLAGGSSYMQDVPAGEDWAGTPGMPIKEYFRMAAAMRRIPDLLKKAKKLGLLGE